MLLPQLSTILLIGFFGESSTATLTAVVKTASGPVQGSILTTVNSVKFAAFTGIPYAKPPLGNLRFKPPLDPDPWIKVYNATKDSPACIQLVPGTTNTKGDEDCLYINVATTLWNLRKAPRKLLPVIYWIYGGAYLTGSSSFKQSSPDYFIEKGIVFVSVNYRTGPFGLMSLNHPHASGNAGLKDLVQGLKWVQKNIAKFGGDPKKVTIMGQSSGAASVGYLVLSNSASGLFHAAISMSGGPLCPWAFHTTAQALDRAHKLTDELGIKWTDPDSVLEALYDVPARNMLIATSYIANFAPFAPTLENKSVATESFLTECIVTKYLTGHFNQIPQIVGYEDQETVSFVTFPYLVKGLIQLSSDAAKKYHTDLPEIILAVKERLNQNSSYDVSSDLNNTDLRKFINETSSIVFIGGVDQTQRFLAANNKNNPVYFYRISFYSGEPHFPAINNSLPGAGHSDEISYLFPNPVLNYSTDPTSPVRQTMDRIQTLWTNFAKYGNPTPDWEDNDYPLNITWPNSGPSGITLEIGNELRIVPRLVTPEMGIYENTSFPYLSEATDCGGN